MDRHRRHQRPIPGKRQRQEAISGSFVRTYPQESGGAPHPRQRTRPGLPAGLR